MTTIAPAVKERPILFSGAMVNAIRDNHKSQTRRLMKPQPVEIGAHWEWRLPDMSYYMPRGGPNDALLGLWDSCPYGQPGDRLWVRETWRIQSQMGAAPYTEEAVTVMWKAGGIRLIKQPHELTNKTKYSGNFGSQWHPSIFMPRWASRLTLEITAVRAERLQAISEADAIAEGVRKLYRMPRWAGGEAVKSFQELWDTINGKRAPWSSNPWVWCLLFKPVPA